MKELQYVKRAMGVVPDGAILPIGEPGHKKHMFTSGELPGRIGPLGNLRAVRAVRGWASLGTDLCTGRAPER